jgi:hypothetical protein
VWDRKERRKEERGKREGSVGFDQTGWNVLAPMFAV